MFRRLEARERRVLWAGVVVSALALLTAYGVVPQVQRWIARESLIAVRSDQLVRVQEILRSEGAVRSSVEALRRARDQADVELLDGGTVAVAASNLQVLLNGYVGETGMTLQRVDAVGDPTDLGGLQQIPARITVAGDIRGLVHLLARLQDSDPFLVVDELRVSRSAGAPGGPETLTALISVHGYTDGSEGGA